MTDTTLDHNFSLTSLNQAYLIQMPLQFTTVEANSFQQFLQQIFQTHSTVKKIILDFGQTTFIDSSGLVGLAQITKLIKNIDFELTFWSFSPQLKTAISAAGLEQVFATEAVTENFVNSDSDRATKIHPAVLPLSKELKSKGFFDKCVENIFYNFTRF